MMLLARQDTLFAVRQRPKAIRVRAISRSASPELLATQRSGLDPPSNRAHARVCAARTLGVQRTLARNATRDARHRTHISNIGVALTHVAG